MHELTEWIDGSLVLDPEEWCILDQHITDYLREKARRIKNVVIEDEYKLMPTINEILGLTNQSPQDEFDQEFEKFKQWALEWAKRQ